MDVKKIPLISGILLILSTLLFVTSILISYFYGRVPYIYISPQALVTSP